MWESQPCLLSAGQSSPQETKVELLAKGRGGKETEDQIYVIGMQQTSREERVREEAERSAGLESAGRGFWFILSKWPVPKELQRG